MSIEKFTNAEEARRWAEAQRDKALARVERGCSDLVAQARAVAEEIDERDGKVTSPQVLEVLRARGIYDPRNPADPRDPRFMGAVFRRGWSRVGFSSEGSHRRLVPVWTRRLLP